jgi:hypothetical protein
MVLPARYEGIQQNGDYFILRSDSGAYLARANGQIMDSANKFIITDDQILAFEIVDPQQEGLYQPKRFQFGRNLTGASNWNTIKPCRLHITDFNTGKKQSPGVVTAFNLTDGSYFLVSSGHRECIYNAETKTFVVPLTYDSIKLMPPVFFLCYRGDRFTVFDEKGEGRNFGATVQYASSIDPNTMNYVLSDHSLRNRKTLYAQDGRMLLDSNVFWNKMGISNYVVTKWKKDPAEQNRDWITDASGRTLVKDIYSHEMRTKRYCRLVRVDTATNNAYTLGIWDTEENKFSLRFSAGPRVECSGNYIEIHYPDSLSYFLYDGQYLGSVTDPKLFQKWENAYFNEFVVRKSFDTEARTLFSLKKTSAGKVEVYNTDGRFISNKYDDIFTTSSDQYLTFRIGNKWGLADASLKEIIAPVYDTNIRIPWQRQLPFNLWVVKKNDRFFYTDTTGKIMFGGKWFSYVQDRPYEGLWLAFDYIDKDSTKYIDFNKKNRISRMYLITAAGDIKKEWKISYPESAHRPEYMFTFTTTGKIIQEVSGDHQLLPDNIYDPSTETVEQVPYSILFPRKLDDRILLLECKNEQGEVGLINGSDFEVVVPFGQYRHFYAKPYDVNGMHAVLITGEPRNEKKRISSFMNPAGTLETVIGVYTRDGIPYWK